jgi:hypothetical protein
MRARPTGLRTADHVGWWKIARWFFTYPVMLIVGGAVAVGLNQLGADSLVAAGIGVLVAFALPYGVLWPLMRASGARRGIRLRLGHSADHWPY